MSAAGRVCCTANDGGSTNAPRGDAVGQIALDLGPARHRHIPHHAQRPSCHGSVRAAAPVADPPDDVESGAFQQTCQSLAKQNVIVGHHHAHRTTHCVIFRQCRPRLNCLRRPHLRRCVDQADFSWQVGAVLGEQGEQLASAPTTTPPVKAIAGPMDSVSVQTPTVVTSDISTWNSPSSTGVTSTRTSVTGSSKEFAETDAG